jgi:hypothetical protein
MFAGLVRRRQNTLVQQIQAKTLIQGRVSSHFCSETLANIRVLYSQCGASSRGEKCLDTPAAIKSTHTNLKISGGGFGGCFGFLGSLPRLSRLPMAISSKIKLDPHRVRFSYAANYFARAKSIAVNGVRNFVCAVLDADYAAIVSAAALPKRKLDATILPNTRSS